MNSVQAYRSQQIARQNNYLKFCFVLSITGHILLSAIAALWFQQPSLTPESDREPISFIVIDAPETPPPIETQQQANINSTDGGQRFPELPTQAAQSSRATLLPRNTAAASPTASSSAQSPDIGDALESNPPARQASQTALSQTQAAEQSNPPEAANSISPSDHRTTPQISSRSPDPAPTPPLAPRPSQQTAPNPTEQSNPPEAANLISPSDHRTTPQISSRSPDPTPTPPLASRPSQQTAPNPTPPATSRVSSTHSTSAADLLPGNDSQTLVAQRNTQLFNPQQTATLPGVDAVRNDLWGPYLARLRQSIVGQWGQIQIDQTRRTRVQFTINRQGVLVGSARITQSSGFSSADAAALRAVQSAAPFGPFPNGVDKLSLTVSFTFNYTLR